MRLWALLAALMAMPAACQQTIEDLPDPFVGDYRGTVETPQGEEPIFAEIICWGDEGYQANLLPTLEERCDPHAVVRGSVVDGVLTFEDGSAVEDGVFSGAVDAGDFEMARFLELSPTLGAEAPTGAVVLFDGTDLEQWHLGGARPWRVNLAEALGGGPDQVAYLAARIHAPEDIPSAVVEIGSDDGVKAWLNGEVVHDNNTHRPISDFEDQVQISLHDGWNALLLKVTQNVGGWEASARISADDEGTPLQGLSFEPEPAEREGVNFEQIQGGHPGTIVTWWVAGPYAQEGMGYAELHDEVLPPEMDGDQARWEIINDEPELYSPWKILPDGAMEIVGGAGSIVTKQAFGDIRLHLEFRTPWEPNRRGQGRGNSGVYLQARHEIQVLESYGMEGENNQCGGLYGVRRPDVNACAPPTVWQTYDVDFRAARFNEETGEGEPARITVRHNGILIHEDVELPGGAPTQPGDGPIGPIILQDHWNPVQYRNIWLVELDD